MAVKPNAVSGSTRRMAEGVGKGEKDSAFGYLLAVAAHVLYLFPPMIPQ